MHNLYYKPSGKFSPISFLYLVLAIAIAAPILAIIYTYATLWIPLIYLNLLCLVGMAVGLGFVANFVVGFGKVRNKMLGLLFGLIVGIFGLYATWVIWVAHHLNASAFVDIELLDLFLNPVAMSDYLGLINEQGTWGFRSGGNVDGTMLTVVWVIEALAIIGVPIFFAFTKAVEPFIENNDEWADDTLIGPFELVLDKTTLVQQLEAKNYEGLLAIPTAENAGQGSHTLLQLYHGENRSQAKEFYLTINNMIEKIDKDGNLDFDEKPLISFISISKEAGQQLVAKIAEEVVVAEN